MIAGHLFSGAGGLRLGFEQAGIATAWEVDILYGQDITNARPDEFRLVSVICGGPPCIHTSQAGRLSGRQTYQSLWPHMLRFVKTLRPLWVVAEQPSAGVARSFITGWAQALERIGYGVAGRIISSEHWLPQRRARWFIVGGLGVSGLALWDYLYPDGKRAQGGSTERRQGKLYSGSCPDCLPGGIFARICDRIPALVGAGNAVSVPVARYLAEKIVKAEAHLTTPPDYGSARPRNYRGQ